MIKKLFTVSALILAAFSGQAQCSDLFFSEYIEGSGSNKAIEIYNPTSNDIDLTDYVVERFNNGGTTPTGTYTFPTGTMITAGGVYVIGNSGADPAILAVSDTTNAATFFNGDDAMTLMNTLTGDTLDIIGVVGVDPGTNWAVGTGATSEFTLVRMVGVQQGTTDWTLSATQWDVLPQNTMDSLGSHTMTPCGPAPVVGPCAGPFFSEYIEGSSSNKAMEIYNPTSSAIDLSDYVVYRNNNGSVIPTDSLFPVGMLAAGDVYVIANPSANAAILAQEDTLHTLTFYNGDDAVFLVHIPTGDTLDIIGEIGVDPGAGWTVGTGATNNFTLIRKMSVNQGSTDWTSGVNEWDVYAIDMTDSLGAHSMLPCGSACVPTTFNQVISTCGPYTSPSGTYTWTSTGVYNDTIFNAQGCDSIYVIDLTVGSTTYSTVTETVCAGYTSPSGQVWTATGTYYDTITNVSGCDSIITYNLTVDPLSGACAGQCSEIFFSEYIEGSSNNKALEIYNPTTAAVDLNNYVIKRHTNGSPTASGTYDFPVGTMLNPGEVYVIANDAADSVVLSVADTTNGATWFNGDDAMTLENVVTGDTIDVIGLVGEDPGTNWPAGAGATSEYTLVRSMVVQQGNNDWATAASEWIALPQNTFDSLGMHTMISCQGCLTTYGTITESSCGDYTSPAGNTYSATGTYYDTLVNAGGCDSIVTINLTVTTIDNTITVTNYVDIVANQSGANYQWIDCDNGNVTITGATSQAYTPFTDGNYAVIIELNGCTDTSDCEPYQAWGINEYDLSHQVVVAPNPTSGKVTVDLGENLNEVTINIVDGLGRSVSTSTFDSVQTTEMEINGEAGYYFVEVYVSGIKSAVIKLIKK